MDIHLLLNPETPLESLPKEPRTPKRYAIATTRSDRIRIKTALDFGHSAAEITSKYGFTARQIQRAKESQLTPRRKHCGRKPVIKTQNENA